MFSGWLDGILSGVKTLNQILTAGIAITAFSLLLYALTFNLRDRVARSFAIILLSVVVVFTSEAIQSSVKTIEMVDLFLRVQWFGLVFLPAGYLHLSDALLVTAGRPSRGRRRWAVRGMYIISCLFLIVFFWGELLGTIVIDRGPAPYVRGTFWTDLFTFYYLLVMVLAWINFFRAYRRMLTRSGLRRMLYLMAGATAPAIGSFPFLLFGSDIAARHPLAFWSIATIINLLVGGLIIVMAYSVAFFGVAWPDRVVKSRLFKWIMRGPVTASITLTVMTLIRRAGETFGLEYNAGVPVITVATILLMEHLITIASPLWERLFFFGRDRVELRLLQNIEERLLTQGDMRQFLEAVLAAVRDHMHSPSAFVAAIDEDNLTLLISAGQPFAERDNLPQALQLVEEANKRNEYLWNNFWILPLRQRRTPDMDMDMNPPLLGLMGVARQENEALEEDQRQALWLLADRAALALEDRLLQQRVFRTLEDLSPKVELLQKIRAVARYDSKANMLLDEQDLPPTSDVAESVREALNHYWGGPKLTDSPLVGLKIVQDLADVEYEGNTANALRTILKRAVEQIRPIGERRFTTEWMLYNILDLKFIEGRKVREVASRLSMSEADLYRKQRVAVEAVAKAILEMETQFNSNRREGGTS